MERESDAPTNERGAASKMSSVSLAPDTCRIDSISAQDFASQGTNRLNGSQADVPGELHSGRVRPTAFEPYSEVRRAESLEEGRLALSNGVRAETQSGAASTSVGAEQLSSSTCSVAEGEVRKRPVDRVRAACKACNERKLRCRVTDESGNCSHCITRGIPCEPRVERKRGRPRASYQLLHPEMMHGMGMMHPGCLGGPIPPWPPWHYGAAPPGLWPPQTLGHPGAFAGLMAPGAAMPGGMPLGLGGQPMDPAATMNPGFRPGLPPHPAVPGTNPYDMAGVAPDFNAAAHMEAIRAAQVQAAQQAQAVHAVHAAQAAQLSAAGLNAARLGAPVLPPPPSLGGVPSLGGSLSSPQMDAGLACPTGQLTAAQLGTGAARLSTADLGAAHLNAARLGAAGLGGLGGPGSMSGLGVHAMQAAHAAHAAQAAQAAHAAHAARAAHAAAHAAHAAQAAHFASTSHLSPQMAPHFPTGQGPGEAESSSMEGAFDPGQQFTAAQLQAYGAQVHAYGGRESTARGFDRDARLSDLEVHARRAATEMARTPADAINGVPPMPPYPSAPQQPPYAPQLPDMPEMPTMPLLNNPPLDVAVLQRPRDFDPVSLQGALPYKPLQSNVAQGPLNKPSSFVGAGVGAPLSTYEPAPHEPTPKADMGSDSSLGSQG